MEKVTINRQTVDLSTFPHLIVIYLGMRVNFLTGMKPISWKEGWRRFTLIWLKKLVFFPLHRQLKPKAVCFLLVNVPLTYVLIVAIYKREKTLK
jgi:hypothetical protein